MMRASIGKLPRATNDESPVNDKDFIECLHHSFVRDSHALSYIMTGRNEWGDE